MHTSSSSSSSQQMYSTIRKTVLRLKLKSDHNERSIICTFIFNIILIKMLDSTSQPSRFLEYFGRQTTHPRFSSRSRSDDTRENRTQPMPRHVEAKIRQLTDFPEAWPPSLCYRNSGVARQSSDGSVWSASR